MSVFVSPYNPVQQAGVRAKNPPDLIIASRAPTTLDYGYFLGSFWLYVGNSLWTLLSTVISPSVKTANWANLGGTGVVSSVTGTANQVTVSPTTGSAIVSLPVAITTPGSLTTTTSLSAGTTVVAGTGVTATTGGVTASSGNIVATLGNITASAGNISATLGSVSAGTTVTATLGNITATNGNLVSSTAGKGLSLPVVTGSGAASGTVNCNGRVGSVTFTTVSIAAGADLTLTMGNTSIAGGSTRLLFSMSGATSGAALSIKSVTPSANQYVWVVTNGTGATTTTADITFDFVVLN